MIEHDKILLAELSALLIRGVAFTEDQYLDYKRLLEAYPEAVEMINSLLEEEKIKAHIDLDAIDLEKEWSDFVRNRNFAKPAVRNRSRTLWISAAASIIVLFGLIWWIIQANNKPNLIIKDLYYGQKNDITPGDTLAILEIEGDERIVLGKADTSGFHQIVERVGGEKNINPKHKLIIPRRAVYHMLLPDGTQVWLNSESELEYYANFSQKERRVILKGEGYFEVAQDKDRPFIVEANKMTMQAIGTAFNVRTYDLSPQVVLAEGKLKVTSVNQAVLIEAGKQVDLKNNALLVQEVSDMEQIKAWKEGYFYFDNKDLRGILTEVSRWYGVQLVYEGHISSKSYQGGIKKNVTLAKICQVLHELTGYQFKINKEQLLIINQN